MLAKEWSKKGEGAEKTIRECSIKSRIRIRKIRVENEHAEGDKVMGK